MRILLLTQWFQPEPHFKGLPFARALAQKGHDVEVLTGFPNYPGGKVYKGYQIRLYQREILEGIPVHRVALYPNHDESAWHRIINYISFALSTFFLAPWLIKKPDIIYVYNLVTLGPSAFLLRLLFGSKVIIDVQDLWPESVTNSGMMRNKVALNLLNNICNCVYKNADKIVALSPGFKNELVRREVSAEKIAVIYNWCDESSIQRDQPVNDFIRKFKSTGKFIILFAGTMGKVQGMDTLLMAAKQCSEKLPEVHFILAGGGVEKKKLEKQAAEMELNNVTFLPPRPIETMGEVFAVADVLLVHLKDDPLFRITIPSKTQAYLYVGKPVIMAVHGDAAELIKKAEAGVVCNPEDPTAIAQAIESMYKMNKEELAAMGKNARLYYENELSLNAGVLKFEKIFDELVKTNNI